MEQQHEIHGAAPKSYNVCQCDEISQWYSSKIQEVQPEVLQKYLHSQPIGIIEEGQHCAF